MNVQNQSKSNIFNQDVDFDAVIIGAGINGAVSAAALSAAGLKVLLVDKGDFASFTSQQSSNLVWGGIKYLQSYEFGLVFKLCLARNHLMKNYPNQVREIGFLASIGPTAPFGRVLGTFGTLFYWGIGLFGTSMPQSFSRKKAKQLEPLLRPSRKAVRYFDAYLPDTDARFVYDFIRHAKSQGASVRNYTELVGASHDGTWELTLDSAGQEQKIRTRAVVNCAGPFASQVSDLLDARTKAQLVLSKGVHLVLDRKITQNQEVLAFWDEEGRLFYVLPMGDRSMVGTTDTRVDDPHTELDKEDLVYVLRQINAQLDNLELTEKDVISWRSGVRPLVVESTGDDQKDWHALSRKHIVETNSDRKVVSVLGGKLTDCLNVGQEMVAEFAKLGFQTKKPKNWFGEGDQSRKLEFYQTVSQHCTDSQAAERIAEAIWRRHGERGFDLIEGALTELIPGLGITAQEVKHIVGTEDVSNREDLLRRRLPVMMSRSEKELAENSELQTLLESLGL